MMPLWKSPIEGLSCSCSLEIWVPKGFRAPGLRPKKCRAPRRRIRSSRAPFGQKQDFCSGSKSRQALGSRLYDRYFRAPKTPLWDPVKLKFCICGLWQTYNFQLCRGEINIEAALNPPTSHIPFSIDLF